MSRSWRSVAAATSFGLAIAAIANRGVKAQTLCEIFDAAEISGRTDATALFDEVNELSFACADNEFFLGFDLNRHTVSGTIQSLRFSCTDGEVSKRFGGSDEFGESSQVFDVGIFSIESKEVEHESYPYIGRLYVKGYDLTLANGLVEKPWGPYGVEAGENYTDTALSTDCQSTGLEAFATGVTVWASEKFVYGIRFACAEVTATCYPPSYPDPPTPAPSDPLYFPQLTPAPTEATAGVISIDTKAPMAALTETKEEASGSRWFDAAWEVAVTVLGALVTGAAAMLLRSCWGNPLRCCKRPVLNDTPSKRDISLA